MRASCDNMSEKLVPSNFFYLNINTLVNLISPFYKQSIEMQEMGDVFGDSDEPPNATECDRRGEGDEPQVLEPTNPLMVRFQKSLKDLLLRQEAKLQEEIITLVN